LQSIGGDDDVFSSDHILNVLKGSLDSYENTWDICSTCHGSLIYFRIPKFSCENRINDTLCQDYPSVLDGLTHVEECLIARYHHPLGVILKLRPVTHLLSWKITTPTLHLRPAPKRAEIGISCGEYLSTDSKSVRKWLLTRSAFYSSLFPAASFVSRLWRPQLA